MIPIAAYFVRTLTEAQLKPAPRQRARRR